MKTVFIFIMFVAIKATFGTDPAKCQRLIKYMLINACGATKREFNPFVFYPYTVMDEEEIDQRYQDMVVNGGIKGLNVPENAYPEANLYHVDNNHIPENGNDGGMIDLLLITRKKREVVGSRIKYLTDPSVHEKRGGFHFIGRIPEEEFKSPLPGALKAKCCGDYLCSLDDFRGFCG